MKSKSLILLLTAALTLIGASALPALAQEEAPAPETTTPGPEFDEAAPPEGTGEGDAQPDDGAAPADGEKPQEGKEGEKTGDGGGGGIFGMHFLWIMIGVFFLFYIFMGSKRRKQESKRREMLSNLKKGDRVMSIGGIIGTVVEARENELVVKVDDNTRMKLARWAVRNAGEEVQSESKDESDKQ